MRSPTTDKEKEASVALTRVRTLPTAEKQAVLATAADKADFFGAYFFGQLLEQEDDDICKWYAIQALGRLNAIEYLPILIEQLRKADAEIGRSSLHRICAWSISSLGASAFPAIEALLTDSSRETRLAAIDTLGEIKDIRGIPSLVACFREADRKLRLWAALSLGKIGPEAIAPLLDSLPEYDAEQIFLLLDTLTMIDSDIAIDAVAKIAKSHSGILKAYFADGRPERADIFVSKLQTVAVTTGEASQNAGLVLSLLNFNDLEA